MGKAGPGSLLFLEEVTNGAALGEGAGPRVRMGPCILEAWSPSRSSRGSAASSPRSPACPGCCLLKRSCRPVSLEKRRAAPCPGLPDFITSNEPI